MTRMLAPRHAATRSAGRALSGRRCLALVVVVASGAAVAEDTECADGQCAAEGDESQVLMQDMKLYDDSRWEYTKRTFENFVEAVDDLAHHTVSPEDATRLRLRLLRSVDVMSYTVGIQELYERFPPRAVHDEDDTASARDRLLEGAALWCHVKDAADPQAHERRVLQQLLTGLSHRPAGKEALRGADIGSGYGGWARMLAFERPDVELVLGVEYQEHVRGLAERLTEYAFQDLLDLRHHTYFWRDVASDANDVYSWLEKHDVASGTHAAFDFMISFLALLHIGQSNEDKEHLFHGFSNRIRPGGRIYIEDIVVLPAALNESRPELQEKVRQAVSMNVFPTHADYSKLLREANFQPTHGAKALVFDTSAAWRNFVLTRSIAFQKLEDKSRLCLLNDARVIPEMVPHKEEDEVVCKTLEEILGNKLANAYLATQSAFFCEVCIIFNGKGKLAKADCQCGDVDEEDHPPLAGGLIAFAERQ